MSKFKVGDKVTIVTSYRGSLQEMQLKGENGTVTKVLSIPGTVAVYEVGIDGFVRKDGKLFSIMCLEEDLEFSDIIDSPLYKALL